LPEEVFMKVGSLLSCFHHEGIPVGVGEDLDFELPAWSSFTRDIRWTGDKSLQHADPYKESGKVLSNVTENYTDKVTLIALGSLKTYADWIKANGAEADKIDRIIWYNSHNIKEGFNYKVSPESFEYIKQSGIKLEIVANNMDNLLVDADYLNHIHSTSSIYASQIEEVHSQAPVVERITSKHLHLWDDVVPLYLTLPILFEMESSAHIKLASLNPQIPPGFVYETIGKLLLSASTTNNRVFEAFPLDTALYKPAYAMILNETINKFGLIEWKAICMTNEIHGHTGIYSIIGAKMGIRAMEYFNVGVNNLEVLSFAGNTPPLSCFNDGVQISTGATVGQGLISISDSISDIPSAIFAFNNQIIQIALDPEIAGQMRNEIKFGIQNYGLLTEKYWLYVERLAIKYWTDFDRQEIFVIEKK